MQGFWRVDILAQINDSEFAFRTSHRKAGQSLGTRNPGRRLCTTHRPPHRVG